MAFLPLQPKPIEHVALSFSGGGFRAASFSLGCLAYMDSVKIGDRKITEHVNFIASASGGSITSMIYILYKRQSNLPGMFDSFYKFMIEEVLEGQKILNRVFEIIKRPAVWDKRPEKSRNLINAFSIAYDEKLFASKTFAEYFNEAFDKTVICVNTTEFDNAMIFRFQNAAMIGNKFLHFGTDEISRKTAMQIKLGDILACSSCFPVGFEPFMFPADFSYETLKKKTLGVAIFEDPQYCLPQSVDEKDDLHFVIGEIQNGPVNSTQLSPPASKAAQVPAANAAEERLKEEQSDTNDTGSNISKEDEDKTVYPEFGIMDGGIDDNQAIDSFMIAEERLQRVNKFGYDLYMSCDVSSNYTSGFNFPEENKKSIFLAFSVFEYLILILLIFGLCCMGIYFKIFYLISAAGVGLFGLLLLYSLFTSFKLFFKYIKNKKKESETFSTIILSRIWVFLNLNVSVLFQLVSARAISAGYLASTVFLKKIRRLSYDTLFAKTSLIKIKRGEVVDDQNDAEQIYLKQWSKYCLQNAVYLFAHKNDKKRQETLKSESWYKKDPDITLGGGQVSKLIPHLTPEKKLQHVANLAVEMDTTLWYDKNHIAMNRPEALIATGHFTTCYNLLRYSFRFDRTDPYWTRIQDDLVSDWLKFQENPFWLYNACHMKLSNNFKPLGVKQIQ